MPSASEADATGKWTERALAARPDLAAAFERALGAAERREPAERRSRGIRRPRRDRLRRLLHERQGAEANRLSRAEVEPAVPGRSRVLPRRSPAGARPSRCPTESRPRRGIKTDSPTERPRHRRRCLRCRRREGARGGGILGRVPRAGRLEERLRLPRATSSSSSFSSGKEWNANPNVRGWPEDYPCETSESEVDPVMFNAVGGSTIHFGAQWARMRPSDFRYALDSRASATTGPSPTRSSCRATSASTSR